MKPPFKLTRFLLSSLILAAASTLCGGEEVSSIEKNLRANSNVDDKPAGPFTIEERMHELIVPGVSVAIVKDRELVYAKGFGIANSLSGTQVTTETLFQAGSISKPLAALAALKLVDQGKVDLDTGVNEYLKEWKVPENKFTKNEKVTLRRLLTHTAGLTVHGFPGYKPDAKFPSTIDVLDGKGNTAPIRVDTVPGSTLRYSGGGYTVMQLLIKDVSGMDLAEFMDQYVFPEIGMTRSTYQQPLSGDFVDSASGAYNRKGKLIKGVWHNYPETAAAGLWTTPTDLAKYCIHIQNIYNGKAEGVLSSERVEAMLTPDKRSWGLGPRLSGKGDSLQFMHGGKNAGFTNNMTAFADGRGAVIVMTNGDNGGRLANEIIRAVFTFYDWNRKEQKPNRETR
ncbi:beta-lactamase [Verrucomicrobiia bacterium DG1235]|nr:beta-lactamase [Verrucomicrobiae bacterium DG1235]